MVARCGAQGRGVRESGRVHARAAGAARDAVMHNGKVGGSGLSVNPLDRRHGLRGGVRRTAIDDDALGHRAQPRELALAELARGEHALVAHRVVVDVAVEILPRLPIADAAHRRQIRVEVAACAQHLHLVDQTRREHCVEALLDAPVQHRAVRRFERDGHEAVARGLVVAARRRGQQRRHRLPGQHPDFERALDALRVVRREARGRGRIDLREARVQRGPAVAGGLGVELRAHGGIGARQIVQTLCERLVVEHRAAHEQRHVAPRDDLARYAQRVGAKVGGGIGIGRIDDIDQMMRRRRAFFRARFRGADIHLAIDERRIDADDLDRAALRGHLRRIAECGGGLAGSGRPEQAGDRRRECVLRHAHRSSLTGRA
ncbi:hypothetical protein PT2222_270122 [Paraburkholderia tropica]